MTSYAKTRVGWSGLKNYSIKKLKPAKKEKPQIEIDIDDLKSKVAKLEADIKKKKNK